MRMFSPSIVRVHTNRSQISRFRNHKRTLAMPSVRVLVWRRYDAHGLQIIPEVEWRIAVVGKDEIQTLIGMMVVLGQTSDTTNMAAHYAHGTIIDHEDHPLRREAICVAERISALEDATLTVVTEDAVDHGLLMAKETMDVTESEV
jgi:hypothetical protein